MSLTSPRPFPANQMDNINQFLTKMPGPRTFTPGRGGEWRPSAQPTQNAVMSGTPRQFVSPTRREQLVQQQLRPNSSAPRRERVVQQLRSSTPATPATNQLVAQQHRPSTPATPATPRPSNQQVVQQHRPSTPATPRQQQVVQKPQLSTPAMPGQTFKPQAAQQLPTSSPWQGLPYANFIYGQGPSKTEKMKGTKGQGLSAFVPASFQLTLEGSELKALEALTQQPPMSEEDLRSDLKELQVLVQKAELTAASWREVAEQASRNTQEAESSAAAGAVLRCNEEAQAAVAQELEILQQSQCHEEFPKNEVAALKQDLEDKDHLLFSMTKYSEIGLEEIDRLEDVVLKSEEAAEFATSKMKVTQAYCEKLQEEVTKLRDQVQCTQGPQSAQSLQTIGQEELDLSTKHREVLTHLQNMKKDVAMQAQVDSAALRVATKDVESLRDQNKQLQERVRSAHEDAQEWKLRLKHLVDCTEGDREAEVAQLEHLEARLKHAEGDAQEQRLLAHFTESKCVDVKAEVVQLERRVSELLATLDSRESNSAAAEAEVVHLEQRVAELSQARATATWRVKELEEGIAKKSRIQEPRAAGFQQSVPEQSNGSEPSAAVCAAAQYSRVQEMEQRVQDAEADARKQRQLIDSAERVVSCGAFFSIALSSALPSGEGEKETERDSAENKLVAEKSRIEEPSAVDVCELQQCLKDAEADAAEQRQLAESAQSKLAALANSAQSRVAAVESRVRSGLEENRDKYVRRIEENRTELSHRLKDVEQQKREVEERLKDAQAEAQEWRRVASSTESEYQAAQAEVMELNQRVAELSKAGDEQLLQDLNRIVISMREKHAPPWCVNVLQKFCEQRHEQVLQTQLMQFRGAKESPRLLQP